MLAMDRHNLTPKMFYAMGTYKTSPDRILIGRTHTLAALARRGFAEKVDSPMKLWRLTDEGVRVFDEIEAEGEERYAKLVQLDRLKRGMK